MYISIATVAQKPPARGILGTQTQRTQSGPRWRLLACKVTVKQCRAKPTEGPGRGGPGQAGPGAAVVVPH